MRFLRLLSRRRIYALAAFGLIVSAVLTLGDFTQAAEVGERIRGYIVLQVQQNGEAWYVEPLKAERWYLGRPDDAFRIMRELALGITDRDLVKIPRADTNDQGDARLTARLSGRILLQVQQNGEAWYVYPRDLRRYYLGRPADAFRIMRELGLGITNEDLVRAPLAVESIVPTVAAPEVTILAVPQASPDLTQSSAELEAPAAEPIDATAQSPGETRPSFYISELEYASQFNAVDVRWYTTLPSTGKIEYGATGAYGQTALSERQSSTFHEVRLLGLSPDTAYHFKVVSRDEYGREESSVDFSVRTLPAIDHITVQSAYQLGALISWSTRIPTRGFMEYGISASYGERSEPLAELSTGGVAEIIDRLEAGTTYHFRIVALDEAGNQFISGDRTFTTPAFENERLPEFLAWADQYSMSLLGTNKLRSEITAKGGYDPQTDGVSIAKIPPGMDPYLRAANLLPSHLKDVIRDQYIIFSTKLCASGIRGDLNLYVSDEEYVRRSIQVPSDSLFPFAGAYLAPTSTFICRNAGTSEMIHELGHIVELAGISYGKGRSFLLKSDEAEAVALYEEYLRVFNVPDEVRWSEAPGFITVYSTKNTQENFADHFEAYVITPDLFRSRMLNEPLLREKYEFLKREIFRGQEY